MTVEEYPKNFHEDAHSGFHDEYLEGDFPPLVPPEEPPPEGPPPEEPPPEEPPA